MAWANYGWAWNVFGVQGSEYVVLLYLANEAGGDAIAHDLKVQKIMQNCNLSRRAVFRFVASLEKKGFIRRKHEWAVDKSQDANTFIIDRKRYFPNGHKGEYAIEMWRKILGYLEEHLTRIDPFDVRTLKQIREVVFQENTRTLYLRAEVDVYKDAIVKRENLRLLKESTYVLKLPVRRFEPFRPRFLD